MMKGKTTLPKTISSTDNSFRARSRWCSGCALQNYLLFLTFS
ncbi:hypothetical protein ECP029943810_0983 [Escherichia coli P0299438.10]|nr:hypothetical protein UMNK88_949 [Escherichia coli UMNK88]AEJ55548.1 hypothetical protein UMNF18_930 [Escherichia coli UMNF18]AWF21569.1 hypothetical protein CSC22_1808 [Escherichia coli]EFV00378.1 hypothetical protein EC3431_0098 [Escherichia coli 3431]EGX12362.1 hypothetical protein ECG581_1096 [Escherichia coli G58-1]EGX19998.1 hypothetical protein ECSTECS1191_1393 [Escherichia coli STEC_S1191]EHV65173.1 hypothetical protein ECDEC6C_0933 [Escherichia coli DEC6C]EHV75206.1 hypothetical p